MVSLIFVLETATFLVNSTLRRWMSYRNLLNWLGRFEVKGVTTSTFLFSREYNPNNSYNLLYVVYISRIVFHHWQPLLLVTITNNNNIVYTPYLWIDWARPPEVENESQEIVGYFPPFISLNYVPPFQRVAEFYFCLVNGHSYWLGPRFSSFLKEGILNYPVRVSLSHLSALLWEGHLYRFSQRVLSD